MSFSIGSHWIQQSTGGSSTISLRVWVHRFEFIVFVLTIFLFKLNPWRISFHLHWFPIICEGLTGCLACLLFIDSYLAEFHRGVVAAICFLPFLTGVTWPVDRLMGCISPTSLLAKLFATTITSDSGSFSLIEAEMLSLFGVLFSVPFASFIADTTFDSDWHSFIVVLEGMFSLFGVLISVLPVSLFVETCFASDPGSFTSVSLWMLSLLGLVFSVLLASLFAETTFTSDLTSFKLALVGLLSFFGVSFSLLLASLVAGRQKLLRVSSNHVLTWKLKQRKF